MTKLNEENRKLYEEINNLIDKFKADQISKNDTTLKEQSANVAAVPSIHLKCQGILRGHINKVNSVHFAGNSRQCITGALDGKLIMWDTWTANKIQIIPLRSAWVMTVAFAPSGNLVACGGMDNQCTIYDMNQFNELGVAKIVGELLGYQGFLSSCRFIDDNYIITGSGDMKICHWNLETGMKVMDINGHAGDIVSLSMAPDMRTYVTGSVDKTAKLWDVRDRNQQQIFFGHTRDVNSVCYHPSGYAFTSASEDKTARLYDIRADQQLAIYESKQQSTAFTSCALSKSGRYLMCSGVDGNIHCFDTIKGTNCGILQGHKNRISSISLSPNGMCLASCSWDHTLRLWI